MKQFIVILFLVIVSVQVLAAGSYTDLFHIGKVGTTANTVLEIGDTGEFRYDFGNSKMQFSHDGTNFYDVIGLDDTVTIQNKTFDQTNKFYFNSFPVFHWNSRGSLIIDKENTTTEGGQIQLSPADLFTKSVYIDNNSDDFRVHDGTNIWFAANSGGLDAASKKIVSVANPTNDQDAATKAYVDSQVSSGSTPVLAKGGLITHSTVDVAQAIGSNGQVLTANSAFANGMKWTNPVLPDHTLTSGGTLSSMTISSLSNTITNLNTGDFQAGAIDTDLTTVSASDNTLASAKAIKTYVDASGGSNGLDFSISADYSYTSIGGGYSYSPSITIVSTGQPVELGFMSSHTGTGRANFALTGGGYSTLISIFERTSLPTDSSDGSYLTKEGQNGYDYNNPCNTFGKWVDIAPPVGTLTYRGGHRKFNNFGTGHVINILQCRFYAKVLK